MENIENKVPNGENQDTQNSSFFSENVSSSNGKEENPKLRFNVYSDVWKKDRLDKICVINPATKKLPEKFYYIDLECVENGEIVSELNLISKIEAPSRAQRLLDINDMLYQTVRPYQKNNFLFNNLNDFPTVASTGYAQIRSTKNNIKYIFQLLHTDNFVVEAMKRSTGTGYPAISSSDLAEIEVYYPSLSEQQKIADFLSLVDQRIEKQRQLVESLKKYKRGLLSAIFERKLRFKDENGNNYPEWENKRISDIFKLTRGYVLATSEISELQTSEFKYPVYSSQTKNEGLLGYYNKSLYKNAITWTTDGANAGYVKFRNGEFYCTNVCGVLLCNKGNCNSYIAEKLNSVTKRHVSYVGNPKLMNNVMAEIYIDFPSIQEQERNSKLLTQIDERIKTANFLYDRLILLKQGLLQQMFI